MNKNIQAKGGLDKIEAVKTLRMTGTAERTGRRQWRWRLSASVRTIFARR